MNTHDDRPKKRFGQNFLHDPSIIQRIIDVINPKPSDNIIEIGPGKGALTKPLLNNVKQLHVIEIDRQLANNLAEALGHPKHLFIHQADALNLDFSKFNLKQLRIVGNLPYNISTPLLFHLLEFSSYIEDMIFMLQKEVVERICAKPGNKQYGRLTIMLQLHFDVEQLFIIKPGAFKPAPKIDSAIVRLMPLTSPRYPILNVECFSAIVKAAFSQRRKTIRNALKNYLDEERINDAGIAPEKRPETLSISDYVKLANLYHQLKNRQL